MRGFDEHKLFIALIIYCCANFTPPPPPQWYSYFKLLSAQDFWKNVLLLNPHLKCCVECLVFNIRKLRNPPFLYTHCYRRINNVRRFIQSPFSKCRSSYYCLHKIHTQIFKIRNEKHLREAKKNVWQRCFLLRVCAVPWKPSQSCLTKQYCKLGL